MTIDSYWPFIFRYNERMRIKTLKSLVLSWWFWFYVGFNKVTYFKKKHTLCVCLCVCTSNPALNENWDPLRAIDSDSSKTDYNAKVLSLKIVKRYLINKYSYLKSIKQTISIYWNYKLQNLLPCPTTWHCVLNKAFMHVVPFIKATF